MVYLEQLPDDVRFGPDSARPLGLLQHCPAYQRSPLRSVRLTDGRDIRLKDETARMGLGSFKALGGVYAVSQLIAQRMREQTGKADVAAAEFASPEVRAVASEMTFTCASAGNHGLSVAAGARIFGARARIHIADTVPESFARRLQTQQADVVRSGATYEEGLAAAEQDAATSGAILLADGSWVGHTTEPSLVMEGYTVLAEEMRDVLQQEGEWPDRVYLQAGVGGFAAAIAHMIRLNWPHQPQIVIVEPTAAPCLRESMQQGRPVGVSGPVSEMGRLDCKEPSLLAYEALKLSADRYVVVSDEEATAAVVFAGEKGLQTTPSGAAGLAAALREDAERPLAIITEGAF